LDVKHSINPVAFLSRQAIQSLRDDVSQGGQPGVQVLFYLLNLFLRVPESGDLHLCYPAYFVEYVDP
jgi:hypothetical protein